MKRKLHLDELAVESFETAASDGGVRGTVRGHDSVGYSGVWSCIPDASCGETCPLSCNPSCIATDAFCCPEG